MIQTTLSRCGPSCIRISFPDVHTFTRRTTPSGLGVKASKVEQRGEAEREREEERQQGVKGVKMTLLEITTATLNVLHYKICDKTLLWGGL